jgi:hypothetical protein
LLHHLLPQLLVFPVCRYLLRCKDRLGFVVSPKSIRLAKIKLLLHFDLVDVDVAGHHIHSLRFDPLEGLLLLSKFMAVAQLLDCLVNKAHACKFDLRGPRVAVKAATDIIVEAVADDQQVGFRVD